MTNICQYCKKEVTFLVKCETGIMRGYCHISEYCEQCKEEGISRYLYYVNKYVDGKIDFEVHKEFWRCPECDRIIAYNKEDARKFLIGE